MADVEPDKPARAADQLIRLYQVPHAKAEELALVRSFYERPELLDGEFATFDPAKIYAPFLRRLVQVLRGIRTAGERMSVDALVAFGVDERRAVDFELQGCAPALAQKYAAAVHDAWARRELMRIANDVLTDTSAGAEVAEVLKRVREGLSSVETDGQAAPSWEDLLAGVVVEIAADRRPGWRSGLPTWDNAVGWWEPAQVTVLGTSTSVGKSALALTLALATARRGRSVVIVSLEMPGREIARRALAQYGNVEERDLWRSQHAVKERVSAAFVQLAPWPVAIADDVSIDASRLSAVVRGATNGLPPCGLVVIDYVQLLRPPSGRHGSREAEVSASSRAVKLMAMELDIPVLLLSQLRRLDKGDAPTLRDLRDSGAIEQDATNVVLMHRPTGAPHRELKVAKRRSGALSTFDLDFDGPTMTFLDPAAPMHRPDREAETAPALDF